MGDIMATPGNSAARAAMCALTLALGACSSSDAGLSTSSLFSPAAPKPQDVVAARAKLAAQTSASAVKCGYNFDPARLRSSYISFETAKGTPPPEVARAEQVYDSTRQAYAANLTKIADFCSEAETDKIKKTLNQQLAGNFDIEAKKPEVDIGLFPQSHEKFDRDAVFDGSKRQM
jgi:hypothetical protein